MTEQERRLWYDFLQGVPQQFYRQRVINDFIVDFCCPSKKIVIELDGSQHYEDEAKTKDEKRDKELAELGFKVLRFSNLDINCRFKEVCEEIYNIINGLK